MAAVNLGRERPSPPHVNQSDAGAYPVSSYGLTVKTSPAALQMPKPTKGPARAAAKSSFNHR